ncbi:sulfurtransferase TusA family protein [Acidianus sp. RZ1]|uniref:sulfurtransferase TusA family protein n=1 Tax=Acidianus sp. RZ1 TaxID=1540082 RepID=UPI001492F0B3|nr:sulfurtransferase TusA family protein [Acidianus sp. RZ1]NON62894.1 sulfurtransferase TusA family protein [Acidianus sp. RZ1]
MSEEKVIDVRGDECPIPELKASKELRKMRNGKLIVLTDHEPAIDVTLPSLCKSLGLNYTIEKEKDYVKFIIVKEKNVEIKVEEGYSKYKRIDVNLSSKDSFRILQDPSVIQSFVPQIKAIRKGENGYVFELK